jgi:chromosome segregation ATPase
MRHPSVNVVVLLLLSVVSHSQAGLFGDKLNKFKNNASARPRRRLTDVPQEPVDHDAATGTVKGAPEDTTKGTCDGQLAQALVAANDKEQQLRIELDAAVNAKAAALESIVQLEAQVEEAKGNMGDFQLKQEEEIKALKAQLATASSETVTAVTAAETTKDTVIRKLEAQLDEAKGDVQTEMEVKLKDAEVLLETTRQEAKRVLVEQVATVKEQMKEMESQAKAALAKKDETISDIKKQNERFSKYNQEMLEAKKTYETVGAHTILLGKDIRRENIKTNR